MVLKCTSKDYLNLLIGSSNDWKLKGIDMKGQKELLVLVFLLSLQRRLYFDNWE